MMTLLCVVLIAIALCLGAAYVMYMVFKDDQDL